MAGSVTDLDRAWLEEFTGLRISCDGSSEPPPTVGTVLGVLHRVLDLIYFIDHHGRMSRFSPGCETLTGVPRDRLNREVDFLGDLVHPEDRAAAGGVPNDRASTVLAEYRIRGRDGDWRWMHSNRLPAIDESGRLCGHLCLDRDTTVLRLAEDKVLRERDRAREYLDIAGVILVAIDADHRVSMINRKGCETLGLSEREIVGTDWFERFVPPQDRHATRHAFSLLMNGQLAPVEYFENRVVDVAGKERLIAWRNTLLRRADGSISGTLSSGEDITEKRQAEGLLRRTEEQFRALFEGTASCIVFIEGKTISYVNDAFLTALGYSREELVGCDVERLHLTPERYRQARETAFQTVLQTGSWRGDWPLRRKDGSEIWMDNYLSLLSGGGVVAVLHDISERRRAENALRLREAELSSIFRAAPVGIGLTFNRVIKDVNQRMCDMLGYRADELIGQNSRLIYPDDESFQHVGDEKYRQIRLSGTGTLETRWRRKDGSIIDVLLSSSPIDPEDWSKGITFTALDITERKKAEQALLDKNVALREVLNQISADQEAIREQIATNIGEAIMPMLDRLFESSDPAQRVLIGQLRRDFDQISSPFLEILKNRQPRLTPREAEICRLIKSGMTSKQIAETLSLSLGTIHKYRELIRRKLGLANVDVNLTSYLQSL